MLVMQVPETEFTRAGDLRIAYQVFGDGPLQVVFGGGPAGHVDIYWEEPLVRRWVERVASFARVAWFDRRGTGASDAGQGPPTLEQYMDDMLAVMEACGFDRPALLGGGEIGRLFALFAATYPERVSALVLQGASVHGAAVLTPDRAEALADLVENAWGKGELVKFYAPSMAGDEQFRRWAARLERNAVSPQGARQLIKLGVESDISDALPKIKVPTLILHRRDDTFVPLSEAEALAEGIPDARLVLLEGQDNMGWVGDQDAILDETEEFLTGTRAERPAERVLSTVLFTDIVGSTDLAARLSDSRWRDLLAEHDRLLRAEVESCDGRVIKSTGDGVLATFDRPAQAVRAARSAIEAVSELGVRVRAGVHTGEVEVLEDDVGGLAVHIGARIVDMAEPEQVLVSGTVGGILVGSGLRFTAEGTHRLRGVPGEWPLYALADGNSSD